MFRKTIGILLFSIILMAAIGTNVFASEKAEINDKEVYSDAVELGLLKFLESGSIEYIGGASDLGLTSEEFENFTKDIESINFLVEEGFASVDSEFEVQLASIEEITEISFNQDNNFNEHFGQTINKTTTFGTLSVDSGFPSLALNSLVTGNRKALRNFHDSVYRTSPSSAYSATVGFFVGKVKPKGPWDYKTVAGYSPWSKKFNATMFGGSKRVVTSEFIGNYNYGFTGKYLFSKKVLLAAGGVVGSFTTPEDADDKKAITEGFDHSVRY